MTKTISRKTFLLGAAAAGVSTFAIHPARAARRYVLKFGVDLAADHPTTLHAIAAGEQIKAETNGDVTVQVFPNNQLGDDTHMLSEIRSGAMQMMGIGDNILATLVPTPPSTISASPSRTARRPGTRWTARSVTWCAPISRRSACIRWPDLGRRLPSNHHQHQADQHAGRSARLQDPCSAQPDLAVDLQASRRRAGDAQRRANSTPRCRPKSSTARKTRSASSRPRNFTRCRNTAR